MLKWFRILPALCLAGAVLVLPACAAPSPSTGQSGTSADTESGTEGETAGGTDAGPSISGPQAADCPQGLRDLAAKLPEESLTGKEISVSKFQSVKESKYVDVGLAPSCVFESTQNNTKLSAFYVGEGKDLVASIAVKLKAEGLTPSASTTDSKQNWVNEYRSVVVSVEHYSVGEDHTWVSAGIAEEFVWVLIAFIPE